MSGVEAKTLRFCGRVVSLRKYAAPLNRTVQSSCQKNGLAPLKCTRGWRGFVRRYGQTELMEAAGSARSDGASRLGRLALAMAVAAVMCVVALTAVAGATRPARRAESRAIQRLLLQTWRRSCCSRPFHYQGARVSTVDARYAFGAIADNSCNYLFGWFLKRPRLRSQRWRTVAYLQDSLAECSYFRRHLPEPVIRDFHVQGGNSRGILSDC